MKKINISKITKQLEAINSQSNKECEAGLQVLINNLEIYNTLLKMFESGDFKQVYLLYQMSATIFKQLEKFNVFPDKFIAEAEVDNFQKMLNRVNN